MAKTDHGWDLLDEDAGALSYEYQFRRDATARCMTARLSDGSLAIISPPCGVGDEVVRDLERFGAVRAIIAPNGFHWLGLAQWTAAFPQAGLYAPDVAARRIAKKLPSLKAFEPLSALRSRLGDGVSVKEVPNVRMGETWLTTRGKDGPIWYVSDTFFSMPEMPPALLARVLFGLTKSAPGFRINGLGTKLFVPNKREYKQWLLERLADESPQCVVTAHGDVVVGDVPRRAREAIGAAL